MSYNLLAKFYDRFQEEKDECRILEELHRDLRDFLLTGDELSDASLFFPKGGARKPEPSTNLSVLDLGCGTGRLVPHFAQAGWSVTAVDASAEMLAMAELKTRPLAKDLRSRIRFLCRDISQLELRQPHQLAICLCDTLNHLRESELQSLFAALPQGLLPGALFVFDLLERDFFRTERGDKIFYTELEAADGQPELCLVWENHWHEEEGIAACDLLFFERENDLYRRGTERILERAHDEKRLEALWRDDFEMLKQSAEEGRRRFVLRRRGGGSRLADAAAKTKTGSRLASTAVKTREINKE